MKQNELQEILTEFAADRVSLIERHEAGARVVSNYDFNNTYQYVIGREETHLTWLQSALDELGSPMPKASATIAVPAVEKGARAADPKAFRAILEDDATLLGEFVKRWRPRVDALTHARHRIMLDVVMGESREHQRLFEQAASGFEDVLGRRTADAVRRGSVLPARWME
ncbi:MAG: hypothetical protein HOP16_15080 [Acidobacteria bacterium]|nr:hypothetical protein [Acidobacteriota bacterium]